MEMVSNQKSVIRNKIFLYGSALYEIFLYYGFESAFVDCKSLLSAKLNICDGAFWRKWLC